MGAVVAKILDKSPAQKAGFKQGDVILTYNGKEIKKSKDLPLLVGSTLVNSTIKVKLLRNKRMIEKYVLIEELPEDDLIAKMKTKNVENTMISGITVSDISEDTKKEKNEIVSDLILAAYNDAKDKLKKKTSEELLKATGGVSLPFDLKTPF